MVKLAASPRYSAVIPSSDSLDNDTNDAIQRALGKARSWQPPGNWSRRDWLDEVQAITAAAGCVAEGDYDAGRGVPRNAFIYRRAIASVWTRYRQEWAYCLRSVSKPESEIRHAPLDAEIENTDTRLLRNLRKALDQLSLSEQWLIRQIFWQGATQGGLAGILRISQQAVSRRRERALKHLRRLLGVTFRSHLASKAIAACAFLDQALDFFSVLDCGL